MNELETKASQSNEDLNLDDSNQEERAREERDSVDSDCLSDVSDEEAADSALEEDALAGGTVPAEDLVPEENSIPAEDSVSGEDAIPEEGFVPEEDPSLDPGAFRHNVELGKRGEDAACSFLIRRGFNILERNWKCAAGEADIIASRDGEYGLEIHFIEVKTRLSSAKGFPSEAVDRAKRKRYETISELYFQQSDCNEARVTFDIISILVTGASHAYLRMHRDVLSFDCR